ncbi:MAG: alpha/beta fold hydrolase [Armatimonadota bacterium]|nr:alpha/beta fold hydrolase [Armatimonadota bacterium]
MTVLCEQKTEADSTLMSRDELVTFDVGKETPLPLYGVLHHPGSGMSSAPLNGSAGPAAAGMGVILLGGWSGTRVGPHGILVAMARELASAGLYALRFDYRGRGDSGGSQSTAHIGTMVEDAQEAARFLREHTGVQQVLLLGVCAGAMVAMAASPLVDGLAGLALWSPPPFHPDDPQNPYNPEGTPDGFGAATCPDPPDPPVQSPARPKRSGRKLSLLKQYWNKLFDPRTWAKLAQGQLQPKTILRLLSGKGVQKAAPSTRTDGNWAGRKPDERLYEIAVARLTVPALFVYGTNDPEMEEAVAYYRRLRATCADRTEYIEVSGANHSFYALEWKAQVIRETMGWIGRLCAGSCT